MFCTLLARSSYITIEPCFVPTAMRLVAVQCDTWRKTYSQLVIDFFHLIEGLDRRENLIQWPLLEVVMVNTVKHNVDLNC